MGVKGAQPPLELKLAFYTDFASLDLMKTGAKTIEMIRRCRNVHANMEFYKRNCKDGKEGDFQKEYPDIWKEYLEIKTLKKRLEKDV